MAERETTTNDEPDDKDIEQGNGKPAATEEPVNPNENPDDPDFAALRAAEAEVAKGSEGQGKAEGEKPPAEQPKAGPEPKADSKPAEALEGGEPKPQMVPIDALHAARRQAQEWRDKSAHLAGQLEALQSFVQKPAAPGPGPQEKTPTERIADLEAALIAAGEKFDNGEIGMAELLKEQRRVEGEIWNLRRDTIQVAKPEPKADPGPQSDLYREEKLTLIEKDHPYVALIAEDRHWNFLRDEAVSLLEQRGISLDQKNPQHDLLFRQTMAELTDVYGPQWTGKTRDQIGAKPSQPDQPKSEKPNGAQPPSPGAQARASKLALAGNLPPDVGAMGGAGDGNDVWTDARIEKLTEEEWESLPPATRAAIERRSGLAPPNT